MRTRSEIEAEHTRTLGEFAAKLGKLAAEHKEASGYLTSFAVGAEGQAKRVREWLAVAHERAAAESVILGAAPDRSEADTADLPIVPMQRETVLAVGAVRQANPRDTTDRDYTCDPAEIPF